MGFLSPPPSADRVHGVRDAYSKALDRLDHPERRLRCIHVAGTNGKGSTAFAISQILGFAGYQTGTYCSPFVFDIRERWMVNAEPVDASALLAVVERVRVVVEKLEGAGSGSVTEFERKTLVAFQLFASLAVDYSVIEVGIGGRLDATNVIPAPLASAITSIGLDHQALLGETRALIAAEKAGILKPGTGFCVTPVRDPEAGPVICGIARNHAVPLCIVDPEDTQWNGWVPEGLPRYQRSNRVVAAQVALEMRSRGSAILTDAQIRAGLESPGLPGRFQVIPVGDRTLLLDVAHNPDGARELAEAIRARFPEAPLTLVVGTSRNHDPVPFLREFQPIGPRIVATEPSFRPNPVSVTAAAGMAIGAAVAVTVPVADAVHSGLAQTPPGGVCCVTGSFFVVGDVPRELLPG